MEPFRIPDDVAEEVVRLLKRLNRGYWESLYWEFQDDCTAFYVRITINKSQNTPQNIRAISCILRSIMAPLLPSRAGGVCWVGGIEYKGELVESVTGGQYDDWKTLGIGPI